MPGLNNLYQNAALLATADTAAKGATGLIAILIARFYGPELYGQYATQQQFVDYSCCLRVLVLSANSHELAV